MARLLTEAIAYSAIIVVLILGISMLFGGFFHWHFSSSTVEGEVVETSLTEDGHEAHMTATAVNTDNETGRLCVAHHFDYNGGDGSDRRITACETDVEPGEKVTLSNSIHADGKEVTRDEIRSIDGFAKTLPEWDNSIYGSR